MAAPAAAPAAAAAAPAAAAAADAASAETKKEEKPAEKAQADVKLISFPDGAKFNVLREVRKLKPGMNLMDVLLSLLSLLSVWHCSPRNWLKTCLRSLVQRFPKKSLTSGKKRWLLSKQRLNLSKF